MKGRTQRNKMKRMNMNKMAGGGGALMTRKENVQIKTKQKSSSIWMKMGRWLKKIMTRIYREETYE